MDNHHRNLFNLSPQRIEKFHSLVQRGPVDSCWPWSGGKTYNGYGRLNAFNTSVRAHRVAYFLEYGVDPKEYAVCHTCDNPPCCNPKHLFLGTIADNVGDMIRKGRKAKTYKGAKGTANAKAKLADEQVKVIRDRYASGAKQVHLAAEYGVTQGLIGMIVRKEIWTHLI